MPTPPLSIEILQAAVDAVDACQGNEVNAAAALGIARGTLQHRLRAAKKDHGLMPKPRKAAAGGSFRLGGTVADREVVRLRDQLAAARRELEQQHRATIDEEEVRRMIGTLAYTPPDPPSWLLRARAKGSHKLQNVPVLMLTDFHRGETVSKAETEGVNAYNSAIMEGRLRRVVNRAVALTTNNGPGNYPGIVVPLLGDLVSGGLHPELQKTDDEPPMVSVLAVRDLLVWAFKTLADVFGKVYVPTVFGNHGRMTLKPEFKQYVYKNADWLVAQLLIRAFEDDPRVEIDARPANQVHFRIWEKRFLAMHGDMMGVKGGDGIIGAIGPIMRGEMKVQGASSAIALPFDHLLIGHWHQTLWLPRVFVGNTIKGYCEYAKNALRARPTAPSQSLFYVHPEQGVTSKWEVFADEFAPAKAAEWVSVFDPAEAA